MIIETRAFGKVEIDDAKVVKFVGPMLGFEKADRFVLMDLNPESPFYVRPRLSLGLLDWGAKFMRAATQSHVEQSAPLLRDFNMLGRQCYVELARDFGNTFGLVQKGLLMLTRTPEALAAQAATEALPLAEPEVDDDWDPFEE